MLGLERIQKLLGHLDNGPWSQAQPWEISVIRDMAKKHMELAGSERNAALTRKWGRFNDLLDDEPMLLMQYDHAAKELLPVLPAFRTERLRVLEVFFNLQHWHYTVLQDDDPLIPWISVKAEMRTVPGTWGKIIEKKQDPISGGWRGFPVVYTEADLEGLLPTPHQVVNGDPPLARALRDILGDIMPVHVKRSTAYRWWNGVDLSETLLHLVGYEEFLLMMYENPDLLHKLLAILQKGVLDNLDGVKAAGDWAVCDMFNYAVLNTDSLPPPVPNHYTAEEKDLWFFSQGQEFDVVGEAQFNEFLLDYQKPIMERFGLISYGCCEGLENKMDSMRTIPNLRRVGVGLRADIEKNAELIGRDYILSWRPFAGFVHGPFDLENTMQTIRKGLTACKGNFTEILVKDIMTLDGEPDRLIRMASACRRAMEA